MWTICLAVAQQDEVLGPYDCKVQQLHVLSAHTGNVARDAVHIARSYVFIQIFFTEERAHPYCSGCPLVHSPFVDIFC